MCAVVRLQVQNVESPQFGCEVGDTVGREISSEDR